MWKGLHFFLKFGWKTDKLYIVERILGQLLQACLPVVAAVMPKRIIDELLGAQRCEWILLYVGILIGFTLISKCFCHFFQMDGFANAAVCPLMIAPSVKSRTGLLTKIIGSGVMLTESLFIPILMS